MGNFTRLYLLVSILFLTLPISTNGQIAEECPKTVADAGENSMMSRKEIGRMSAEISTESGKCGGAIVAPNLVLTSKACDARPGASVRLGNYDAKKGERLLVSNTHTHRGDELILLQLSTSSVSGRPVKLHDQGELLPGIGLRVGAFGNNSILEISDVKLISPQRCRSRIGQDKVRNFQPREQICTERPLSVCPPKALCAGSPVVSRSPGGLLVLTGISVGSNSSSELCSAFPEIAVFSRVTSVITWIQATSREISGSSEGSPDGKATSDDSIPTWIIIGAAVVGGVFFLAILLRIFVAVITRPKEGSESFGTQETPPGSQLNQESSPRTRSGVLSPRPSPPAAMQRI